MRFKHLEIFELRERAFSAREKAADARRLARRVADASSTLELHAAEFDEKAAILEREIEEIEEQMSRRSNLVAVP